MKRIAVLLILLTAGLTLATTKLSVGFGFVLNQDRQTKDMDLQFFGRIQAGWPVFGGPLVGIIADIPVFGIELKKSEFYTLDPEQTQFGLFTEIGLDDFSPALPPAYFKATLMTELRSVLRFKRIEYLPLISHIEAGYRIGDFSLEVGSTIVSVGFSLGDKIMRNTVFFPHLHLVGKYGFGF